MVYRLANKNPKADGANVEFGLYEGGYKLIWEPLRCLTSFMKDGKVKMLAEVCDSGPQTTISF